MAAAARLLPSNKGVMRHLGMCRDSPARCTRTHGAFVLDRLVVSSKCTSHASPWGGVSAVMIPRRHVFTTSLLSLSSLKSPSSGKAPMLSSSARRPPSTERLPRSPPPPPLSLLSWAVDGSGHTHHRCRRRLSLEQRIPLVCKTVRTVAPDVVALQDSTPELAEALVNCFYEGTMVGSSRAAPARHLRIDCAELAHSLRQQELCSGSSNSAASPAPAASPCPQASSTSDDHENQPQTAGAPAPAASFLGAPAASAAPCVYRLVGSARNGRCGEVQLFIKEGSAWDAELIPGMGAGLTAELRSRIPAASLSPSLIGSSPVTDTTLTAIGDATTSGRKLGDEANAPCHRCVLTTLDLSYRGKSLGTNAKGLLADAAVSAGGSPFTLQTQQPSSSSVARRHGRAPGQLDVHRSIALDWVHHHVRPDVLVGNLFIGAQEHVPGFEDSWVRAGSPPGQERTTNTCARHRVDRTTNYFYFFPSRGVAPLKVMERLMHTGSVTATTSGSPSSPPAGSSVMHGAMLTEAEAERVGRQTNAAADATTVAVAADAPVGTPVPLSAYWDSKTGSWQHSPFFRGPMHVTTAEHSGISTPASSSAAEHRREEGEGDDDPVTSGDITVGVPEVAGRFQRCLLRGWMRRGPASRSGHLSAHPFLGQYRRCRVVVLRPSVEVELSAAERDWHTRYIAAQYSKQRSAPSLQSTPIEAMESNSGDTQEEAGKKLVDASDTELIGEAPVPSPRQTRMSSRVRCSVSDQYPLLTLLG